jgi:ASC-1-like (ASCH) protein
MARRHAPCRSGPAIEHGDEIVFTCGKDYFSKKVNRIYHWPTVEAMVAEVPLTIIMPGLLTVEEARGRYSTYPGYMEKIEKGGIFGFELV